MRITMSRTILFAVLISLSICGNAYAQSKVPPSILKDPILIIGDGANIGVGQNSGSGFCLHANNKVYLITAKHVLYDLEKKQYINKQMALLIYPAEDGHPPSTLLLNMAEYQSEDAIKLHPTHDIAVIRLFNMVPVHQANGTEFQQLQYGAGVTLPGVPPEMMKTLQAQKVRPENTNTLMCASLDQIKTFDQVLVGNDVMIFGYPTSLGLQATPELDVRRPLLRKGIVAGVNPDTKSIIMDSPVYFGNSGGMVTEIDQDQFALNYKIIGVVSKYVPYAEQTRTFTLATNSGYSIAEPMDYVLELIKQDADADKKK